MKLSPKITNFIIYGLGQSINLFSPLIVMPYLLVTCKESGIGKIGIAFSIALILNCIVDYSSYLNGTKDIVIHRDHKTYLSSRIASIFMYKAILFILIATIFSVVVLVLPIIQEKMLFLLSMTVVISQLLNPNWLLQGLEDFKQIALLNVLSKVIYIGLTFICIKQENDYIYANFCLGISGVIVYTIALIYIFKKYEVKFNKNALIDGIKIIRSDFNICISEFCLSIYQYIPIVIIGFIGGHTVAGLYRIIEQVFSIFRTFIFMFFNYSFPSVCLEISNQKMKGLTLWKKYHLANFAIILFGCITIILLKDFVFDFFHVNKNHYNLLDNILIIAMLTPLFIVISQAFRQLMFAFEMVNTYTRIIYISSALNVILLFIMVKFFNLKGAFYAMIGVEIFVISAYYYVLHNAKKMNYED